MASNPTPTLGTVIRPDAFPPAAAAHIASKLLDRHSAREIAGAVEVLVELLDLLGGDPDVEDDDPAEALGDEADAAWLEWHNLPSKVRRSGGNGGAHFEDDEPTGDEQDGSFAEDEPCRWFMRARGYGPGCEVSDPDRGIEDQPEGTLGLDC